jgi:hypothetical protein
MNIDTGLAIVILAVLIFYLRLIILQRERAKRLSRVQTSSAKKKDQKMEPQNAQVYSILSPSLTDRIIAGAGILAILAGVLLNTRVIPLTALQPFWWIPTALGVIAFSWAFKL